MSVQLFLSCTRLLGVGLVHRNTTVVEEHMVICDARRQSYIGEVAVDRGTGENIGVEVGFIEEKPGLNTEDVIMVGGDSRNVNVGK